MLRKFSKTSLVSGLSRLSAILDVSSGMRRGWLMLIVGIENLKVDREASGRCKQTGFTTPLFGTANPVSILHQLYYEKQPRIGEEEHYERALFIEIVEVLAWSLILSKQLMFLLS